MYLEHFTDFESNLFQILVLIDDTVSYVRVYNIGSHTVPYFNMLLVTQIVYAKNNCQFD